MPTNEPNGAEQLRLFDQPDADPDDEPGRPAAADAGAGPEPPTPAPEPGEQPEPAGPSPVQESSAVPGVEEFGRRRRPEPQGSFERDETDELDDFHDELRKSARRTRRSEPTRDQAEIALQRWHEALQVEGESLRFVSNAGRTGIVAHEWLVARYGAMVMPAVLESPQVWEITGGHRVLRVLSFQDTSVPLEPGRWVLETDIHAQYLAAAHSTNLGDGEPTHHLDAAALAEADQVKMTRCPGYVRLAAAPDLSELPGHVQGAFAPAEAGWWVPTPLAAYLVRDCGLRLQLDEAIVWHERLVDGRTQRAYGTRLARWAKVFVAGRERLMLAEHAGDATAGLAVGVVKACYSTFLGGLLRSTRHNDTATLRPDWNDQIVATGGANMLRALDKAVAAGARPLGAAKDAAWWVTDEHVHAPDGLVVTGATSERPFQPGKWHLDRRAPVDEQLAAAHRTGSAARFLKALIAADDERAAAQQEGTQ